MYFIVYETTNLTNGMKYRGAHITNDLQDTYLGSGKYLLRAIEKYGRENFSRSILQICKSVEDMFITEAKYVDADWVKDPSTYNLKVGGEGGWDYVNRTGLRWNEEKKVFHSIEMKKKRASGEWGPNKPSYGFKDRNHSEETKLKISMNNAMNLSKEEIESRISDIKNVKYPIRGSIIKLSKLWNVSHTQVKRFIDKFYLGVA